MNDYLRLCLHAVRHALDFSGRASRAEFLAYLVLSQVPLVLATWLAPGPFEAGVRLGAVLLTAIPLPALAIRRLHDFNTSGRWSLILIVLLARFAVLEVLTMAAGWEARGMVEGPLAYFDWLLFIPGAALCLLLFAAPGSTGENRFGRPPGDRETPEPSSG